MSSANGSPSSGPGGLAGALGTSPASGLPPINAFTITVAWGIVFLALYFINRTRVGHTLVYYVLALALLFLVVTQAGRIAALLYPLAPDAIRNQLIAQQVGQAGQNVQPPQKG